MSPPLSCAACPSSQWYLASTCLRACHCACLSGPHPSHALAQTCSPAPAAPQYYFETIFPRIPTKVTDEVLAGLKARGLPCKALGNAGQGGEDRRGIAESAARPASVKQSLSVAMGQRAPNRASARELGRGTGADLQLEQVMKRKERASPVRGAERREARSRSRSPRGAPVARCAGRAAWGLAASCCRGCHPGDVESLMSGSVGASAVRGPMIPPC